MNTTKILAINVFIFMIPIMAILYSIIINSGSQDNESSSNKKVRCDNNNNGYHIRMKMFDSQIVPKYIIGKDYKIIPVNPSTTDVLVDGCTLASRAISQ
jgi:hypothetical protein